MAAVPIDPSTRRTCIDAFCGAGGLSLGLLRAGFDVRAAFDLDHFSIETYRQNLGPQGSRGMPTSSPERSCSHGPSWNATSLTCLQVDLHVKGSPNRSAARTSG